MIITPMMLLEIQKAVDHIKNQALDRSGILEDCEAISKILKEIINGTTH